MSLRFNPPPGWSVPEGFVPPDGWQPDPAWPPPPPGWQWWVDPTASDDPQPDPAVPHQDPRVSNAEFARWQENQDRLDAMARYVERAVHDRGGSAYGVLLKANESALWAGAARLVEPRRQPGYSVGRSSGVSVRVAKGMWVRTGSHRGQRIPGPELQTPIDHGQVTVTTTRVLFTGSKMTREWAYDKLLTADTDPAQTQIMLPVTNRQKVSGILFAASTPQFPIYLEIGLAIAARGADTVVRELAQRAREHEASAPPPPTM